jgi:hypothetical protein
LENAILKPELFLTAALLLVGTDGASAHDLLGLRNPASISANDGEFVYASALLASTFTPLADATSEQWHNYAPQGGNNLDLVSVHAGLGFTRYGVMLGVLQRMDWLGQAQKGTLDVYRAQQLNLPLPVGASYPIQYELKGFEASGVSVGKAFQWEPAGQVVQIGLTGSLLQGSRVKSQSATGRATALGANTLGVEGFTSNKDSHLNTVANSFNTNVQNGAPSGSGYSVDLGLRFEHENGMRFEWTMADALGEMHWSDIPEITLGGNSTFNGQFPSGSKVRSQFTETLPTKNFLQLSIPVGGVRLEVADNTLGPLNFPSLGVSSIKAAGMDVGIDYDFYFNSVGLQLSNSHMRIKLRSDNLNLNKARALLLGLEFRW